MERNLPGNHSFRLNEDTSTIDDERMHIFVKLTDSCMKTIETYIKQNKKGNSSNKANIKFNVNGGELSIPTNNGERKIYSFQISPENKTPEVFECIKQTNRDELETCGLIEQRVNIHAQEDVYSMTKTKVTEFQKNEEKTKKQTKEIGESSKTILQKKTNKSSNQRSSTSLNNPKQRLTTNEEHHLSPTTTNPVYERPLKERLIHLLAARTYRKPDLLARLKHDGGIRDDEKEHIDTLLSTITTQSKTGEFVILKQLLLNGEVNSDWPFYPQGESSIVRKKMKELQANATRSNINKTNDTSSIPSTSSVQSTSSLPSTSNRLSLPNPLSKVSTANCNSIPTKVNSSSINPPIRSTTNDDRNQLENEETSTQNPLSDDKMQQLSSMLDKLTNAISVTEKRQSGNEEIRNEMDSKSEDDLDEAENEYNRLAPEYNHLIDYLQTISDKFSVLELEFNEEQNTEKASRIVDEFFKCENSDGFLLKRQRLFELHFKLRHLQKVLEKTSSPSPNSNSLHFSEDEQ